jgi:hypothetical protein
MRVAFVCIREHWGQSEGPEEKVSRYTVRPGTLGWTLCEAVADLGVPGGVASKLTCED